MLIRAAHVHLHEGTGQLLGLPGGGFFAGAQAHDDISDADRLAGFQRQVTGYAVALVEQADHRDPLGHRRTAAGQRRLGTIDRLDTRRRAGTIGQDLADRRFGRVLAALVAQRMIAEPATDAQRCGQRHPGQPACGLHPSGVQAS